MAPKGSTAPEDTSIGAIRRARLVRRCFVVLLVAFLACAATGLLGVRTTTTSVSGGGYRVELFHARIARPGLAVPWRLAITRPGGFDGPVHVTTSSEYLDTFDENGLDPDPSKVTQDADKITWEFDPPSGDTLTVSFDWRIEPGVQLKKVKGETSVLDDNDRPVVTVRYHTWVTP